MLIRKTLAFCCSKRFGTLGALSITAAFLILSLTRSYPYADFQTIAQSVGDDWNTYARYALDIKHHGILMPLDHKAYYCPGSFLYSYFIALFLVIFGEKALPIFIAQHLMLGLSVALVYWTFRDKMKNLTGLLFLFALLVFAYKDFYKNYSSLLLSENLAVFTVAVFFFCFVKGLTKNNFVLQLLAAFFMGLSILTRPNLVIYGIALVPLVALRYLKKEKKGLTKLLIFVCVLLVSSSFLMIRNYLVCRKLDFLPVQVSSISFIKLYHPVPPSVDLSRVGTNIVYSRLHLNKDFVEYIEYALQKPALFFGHYLKKIIFCLGFLPVLVTTHELRLRWVLMWAGYFVYVFMRVKKRERFETWETASHLFIFCFYGSLVVSGPIVNYGFRMLIPALPFVLVFSFLAIDRLIPSARISR